MPSSRQLAAIMFTDIVGYTALMGDDEDKAFELLNKNRQLQKTLIEQFNGRWIKELGDGVLASFTTVIDAVNSACSIMKGCADIKGLQLRIGIHLGDVVFENKDVFGDGVNIASRLQALAPAGEILVSEAVYTNIKNKQEVIAEFFGEETLKNVAAPVKVYLIKALATKDAKAATDAQPKNVRSKGKLFNEKKLLPFILGLIALIAVLFFYFKNQKPAITAGISAPTNIDKSIAVLPFTNMSNDPQQDYFADGMMDEILNHLFKIGDLQIISRTSAMAYKGTKKSMKDIARELGVANLLEGSVQKEGERIRIRVQLINGKTDKHVWAETYEREYKDVFAMQSDIAQKVAGELKIKIDPDVKERIESRPTKNTEAYNLYLKARDESSEKSKSYLESAIALDSTFAGAYARLAGYWISKGGHAGNLKSEDVIKNAQPLLEKALSLNPDLAAGHVNLARLYLVYKWDFDKAQREYQKVSQLNPSNTDIPGTMGHFLLATGRFKEALDVSVKAFNQDSTSPARWAALALGYYFNNNPKTALQTIEAAATRFNKESHIWVNTLRINVYAGEYKNAILYFEKNRAQFNSTIPWVLGHAAIAYYKTGKKDSTDKFLKEIISRSKQSPVGSPAYFAAAVYTAMGENAAAIQWLEKAYTDREVEMYWLKVEPLFTPLYNEPGFRNIINKMNYPK